MSKSKSLLEAYRQVITEQQAPVQAQVNVSTLVSAVQELQNSINTYLEVLPKDPNATHPVLAHDLQIIKQLQEGIFDITGKYSQHQ